MARQQYPVMTIRLAIAAALAVMISLAAPDTWAALAFDAKSLEHSGYVVDRAYIRIADGQRSGTASLAFDGPAGSYDVQVFVVPEADGQPTLEVRKNEQLLETFQYPAGDDRTVRMLTLRNVALLPGDILSLVGRVD